jgi:hypothetical protein
MISNNQPEPKQAPEFGVMIVFGNALFTLSALTESFKKL